MGIIATMTLKQTLNLVSNGSMILMAKVDGNKMIDVAASNNKLIDRTIRLVQQSVARRWDGIVPDYEVVYRQLRAALAYN